jgi:hypothetical protein
VYRTKHVQYRDGAIARDVNSISDVASAPLPSEVARSQLLTVAVGARNKPQVSTLCGMTTFSSGKLHLDIGQMAMQWLQAVVNIGAD